MSLTVAVMVAVFPPTSMVGGHDSAMTVSGAPTVKVTWVCPSAVPEVAVTFAVPMSRPEVRVALATPLVVTVTTLLEPTLPKSVSKVTSVPSATRLSYWSLTVAVISEVDAPMGMLVG